MHMNLYTHTHTQQTGCARLLVFLQTADMFIQANLRYVYSTHVGANLTNNPKEGNTLFKNEFQLMVCRCYTVCEGFSCVFAYNGGPSET